MKKKTTTLLLLIVLLISFVFRFWKLSSYPVSLSIDEVIIGYDAYSISKTARDHWGEFLPLAFKSVGDYKAPVLIYLMIPAIKLFGLNEWGIRFTVALVGSLTPLVVFFLIETLFKKRSVSFLTAMLSAISPWQIQFSRASFEAILALFFFLLGTVVFFSSFEKKGRLWWLAAIFYCLAIYSYHSERIFIPLFLFLLLGIFHREILEWRENTLKALGLGIVLLLPFAWLVISPQGQTRAKSVFLTNDYELRTLRLEKMAHWPDKNLAEEVLNGDLVNTISFWGKRFLEYTDLNYLFFEGMHYAPPKFPNVGLMLFFELPFFLWGIFALTNSNLERKKKWLILGWLSLGVLPASLANNSQHPLRSLTTIPIPQLFSAWGIYSFFTWLKTQKLKQTFRRGIYVFAGGLACLSLVYFIDVYFVHYPVHYSHYWMYGFKEIAQYLWQNKDKYDQIIIDADFGIEAKNITGIPYAYILVYGKTDPSVIQAAHQEQSSSFGFENFVFREVYWPKDKNLKNTLLVASFWQLSPQEIPSSQVVKVVSLYNKTPMFYFVETDFVKTDFVKTSIW